MHFFQIEQEVSLYTVSFLIIRTHFGIFFTNNYDSVIYKVAFKTSFLP